MPRSTFPRGALVVLALAVGCSPGGREHEAPPAGHARHEEAGSASHPLVDPAARPFEPEGGPRSPKHAELLEIARRLRAGNEAYFGEETWRRLSDVSTEGMAPEEIAAHEYRLGWESFKLGHPEEAEGHFLRSLELAPSNQTRYWLGVAQLRIGEQQNCLARHSPESCVFPLAGDGIHADPGGAERALATFLSMIDNVPLEHRPKIRWFVNLAAMALDRWPGTLLPSIVIPEETFASPHDVKRFPDVAMELGISPMNLAGGAAMDDFDGDGLLDVITSSADIYGQLLFFRNDGRGGFTDVTEQAGLVGQLGGLNLVHADYDDDGDQDVLILRGGWMGTFGRIPNSLLRNDGTGRFTDVTDRAGIGEHAYPTQVAAFADYDLDGDLDLFLGNEMPPPASGQRYPCQLFRNEGDGSFVDVAKEAGVENFKLTKGAAWGDYDGDRDPDLYVSNQFDVNRLYRNEGDGTFTDVAPELGLDEPRFSFPVWFWDYDNDGHLDLFVAGYGGDLGTLVRSYLRPGPRFGLNALYRNDGRGGFTDLAKDAGLTLQTLVMGANFGDLDNDGWLDFYLGTGSPEFDALMPDVMFRSDGHGGFQDVTTSGGFGNLQKGHGIAWGDVDNDGDQDIYLQSGGIYPYDGYFNSLFLNPGHGHRWITLRLVGVSSNRDALGARVRVRFVEDGAHRETYHWVWPSGSFGSSSRQLEIGLGRAERIEEVEVYWPVSDVTQRFEGLDLDSFYRITEGDDSVAELPRPRIRFRGT